MTTDINSIWFKVLSNTTRIKSHKVVQEHIVLKVYFKDFLRATHSSLFLLDKFLLS